MTKILNQNQLKQLIDVAKHAGEIILDIYNTDFNVDYKEDESPLTIADQRANQYIVDELSQLFPHYHFITEETKNAAYIERKDWEYTWIIDPLDGTKEFVKRNGEFTVNIALCKGTEIHFGIIYVPVTGDIYYAMKGEGSFKIDNNGTQTKLSIQPPKEELIVVASRSHRSQAVDDYVNEMSTGFENVIYQAAGSSLKLCLVAEGKAHIYPRLGPTMEWDTAAGHIIAEEAGAMIIRHDNGEPLAYNKEDLLNPFFIVTSFSLS